MAKYYHYVIEEIKTGKRQEIIAKNQNGINKNKYKLIACCGYHEKGDKQ